MIKNFKTYNLFSEMLFLNGIELNVKKIYILKKNVNIFRNIEFMEH